MVNVTVTYKTKEAKAAMKTNILMGKVCLNPFSKTAFSLILYSFTLLVR